MTPYNHCKTMELLGFQYYNTMITEEYASGIGDIVEANTADGARDPFMMYLDLFVYGFMAGKRSERMKHTDWDKYIIDATRNMTTEQRRILFYFIKGMTKR